MQQNAIIHNYKANLYNFMNKNNLEKTILDQHARVKSAGIKGHEVLGEAKGEIIDAANPDQVQEILDKTLDMARLVQDPVSSHLAGVREDGSLPRRIARIGSDLYTLSDGAFILPNQGYVGFIATDAIGQAYSVHGYSAARGQQIQDKDPIQEACGEDFLYPAMMWAKALYSEAYRNRPDSQKRLPIYIWLAELAGGGLFQGSIPIPHGLLGATGFMPSDEMMGYLTQNEEIKEHIDSEGIESFRASGLMDQVALFHLSSSDGISMQESRFRAGVILREGGSLN